jgi:hypothetical protein
MLRDSMFNKRRYLSKDFALQIYLFNVYGALKDVSGK